MEHVILSYSAMLFVKTIKGKNVSRPEQKVLFSFTVASLASLDYYCLIFSGSEFNTYGHDVQILPFLQTCVQPVCASGDLLIVLCTGKLGNSW